MSKTDRNPCPRERREVRGSMKLRDTGWWQRAPHADPQSGSGSPSLPKAPCSVHTSLSKNYYWDLDVCSFKDSGEDI